MKSRGGTRGRRTPVSGGARSKRRSLPRLDLDLSRVRDLFRKLVARARAVSSRALFIVAASLAAGMITFGLSQLKFFNLLKLDNWVESNSVVYMRDFVDRKAFDKNIKIVLIEEGKKGDAPFGDIDKKHRKFFGDLVEAMSKAHAKVLAFDIAFEGDSPEFDADFGNKIGEAERHGLPVVVGVDSYKDGKTDPELPEGLKGPVRSRWGTILVGGTQGDGDRIRTAKLAEDADGGGPPGVGGDERPVIPSFALQVLMQTQRPPLVASFNEGERRLILRSADGTRVVNSIPVESGMALLIDPADPNQLKDARVPAQTVYDELNNPKALEEKFKDQVVLVAYEKDDLQDMLVGGKRLGIEIHATSISNVLHEIYVYKLLPGGTLLVILFMTFLGTVLHTRAGRWLDYKISIRLWKIEEPVKIPVTLFIIGAAYLLAAFVCYKRYRILLDVNYHLAAVVLSYFLVWLVLKKRFPSQTEWRVT